MPDVPLPNSPLPDPPLRLRFASGRSPLAIEAGTSGPGRSSAELDAFEARLGQALPREYRAFLLQANGGVPVGGALREAAPPELAGLEVSEFLGLEEGGLAPPTGDDRRAWGLPPGTLVIARGGGGERYVLALSSGEVRLMDPDAASGWDGAPAVAPGFAAFAALFLSPEEQAAQEAQERADELAQLRALPLPEAAEEELAQAAHGRPEWGHLLSSGRMRAHLAGVLEVRASLALQEDPASMRALTALLWVRECASGPGITLTEMTAALEAWVRRPGTSGLVAVSRGAVAAWWRALQRQGELLPLEEPSELGAAPRPEGPSPEGRWRLSPEAAHRAAREVRDAAWPVDVGSGGDSALDH